LRTLTPKSPSRQVSISVLPGVGSIVRPVPAYVKQNLRGNEGHFYEGKKSGHFPISCVSGENPGKKSGHFPISCVSGENPGKKSKKSGHFYEEPPVKLGFL
jgi:hypothetical protein